ncbi:uncharacterized protein PHACADRAFT_214682 [Phanerochaete carnosa HHB-10118-sp]|uniref:Aminoacyl-tRNA synthetase class II (D/K/N) domain-containing protein n=1 Tax=Phanerochaete carnosa (strain HHB-10118-sp) TaxID=650164 RepID=K5UGY4_PHACS|nr:uncharacterized protein PHACADRAFT_214682 [Phanerochaete carnosa HHB-10118-sp]EKM48741.1 hypothetical protein PHACADRAFT_214682 [Phanerochaete carnosa HHB-10118-sp]
MSTSAVETSSVLLESRDVPRLASSRLSPQMVLLSPDLHQLPSGPLGLEDWKPRHHKRSLDLTLGGDTVARRIFIARNRIADYIHRFFDTLGFFEVEIPMTGTIADGAVAKPFMAHHDGLDFDLRTRSRACCGTRVVDLTHMVYADMYDIVETIESLIEVPDKREGVRAGDLKRPWLRYDMRTVEEKLGAKILVGEALRTEEANKLLREHNIECSERRTNGRVLGTSSSASSSSSSAPSSSSSSCLPPTGGWGISINRLMKFLTTDLANTKEALLFPAMIPTQTAADTVGPVGPPWAGLNLCGVSDVLVDGRDTARRPAEIFAGSLPFCGLTAVYSTTWLMAQPRLGVVRLVQQRPRDCVQKGVHLMDALFGCLEDGVECDDDGKLEDDDCEVMEEQRAKQRKGQVFEDAIPGARARRRSARMAPAPILVAVGTIDSTGATTSLSTIEQPDQMLMSIEDFKPEEYGLLSYNS